MYNWKESEHGMFGWYQYRSERIGYDSVLYEFSRKMLREHRFGYTLPYKEDVTGYRYNLVKNLSYWGWMYDV